jgi:flagellar assembly protein FliH
MSSARKFLFDFSFDAPEPPPDPQIAEAAAAEATREAELAALREAAFAEGRMVGVAEAASRAEAQSAAALERIEANVARLLAARAELAAAVERQAMELLLEMGRRVVPALARRNGLEEIAAMVALCLREAADEPRVVLRVADANFENLRERAGRIGESAGFAGKIVILADEALQAGDCRVEWADGGAERDAQRTWREIDAAMMRALESSAKAGTHRGE